MPLASNAWKKSEHGSLCKQDETNQHGNRHRARHQPMPSGKAKLDDGGIHRNSTHSIIIAISVSKVGASGRAVRPPASNPTDTQPTGQDWSGRRKAARSLHNTGLMEGATTRRRGHHNALEPNG
eukprot:10343405-Karenia_brevis.AAC.1